MEVPDEGSVSESPPSSPPESMYESSTSAENSPPSTNRTCDDHSQISEHSPLSSPIPQSPSSSSLQPSNPSSPLTRLRKEFSPNSHKENKMNSPPSSLISKTPPSSPLQISNPSSPIRSPEPKKKRSWHVFPLNSDSSTRQPGRSTLFKLKRNLEAGDNNPVCVMMPRSPSSDSFNSDTLTITTEDIDMNEDIESGKAPNEGDCTIRGNSDSEGDSESNLESDLGSSSANDSDSCNSSNEDRSSTTSGNALNDDEEPFYAEADYESDESTNEQEETASNETLKLFDGSEYTVDEAILDLFENHLKNKETKRSFESHLLTFTKYLPKSNNFPKSKYHLFKYVENLAPLYEETTYQYCANCNLLFLPDQIVCRVCNSTEKKTFYGFCIEKQIKHYFENCKLHEILKTGDNVSDIISDICNGSEYKKIQSNHEFQLTLMMNTDGISVSHSSRTSLYPLMYMICEVPPRLRSLFMIICGVWCDTEKPNMNIFLRPFCDTLVNIHNAGGVSWKHPDSGVDVKSPVMAPLFCADAPVRAQLQNILSHNGKYSCNTCEQKMEKIPLTHEEVQLQGQGQQVRRRRAFLFKVEPARLRSNRRMLKQATKASQTSKPVKGVKGPSVLSLMSYINLASCVFGEYMHLICLGVVKRFMHLWFNINEGEWYIGNHSNEISIFLKNILPPSLIGRLPRGISDMKYWKASEFRAFLLYYSLPALQKFLPNVYFQHWMLFVMSVFLLLQDKITSNDILQAEIMLRLFVRDIGTLYRNIDYVYNVHELLHLPLYVTRWGPLWATSAFWFEKYNGIICGLVHGTKNIGKELINNIKLAHGVEMLRQRVYLNKELKAQDSQFKVLNKCTVKCLNPTDIIFLKESDLEEPYLVYARVHDSVNMETFTSLSYGREKKRNNSTVFFECDEICDKSSGYGEIKFFVSNESGSNIFAVINVFKVRHTAILFHEGSRTKVKHIVPVVSSNELKLLPIQSVLFKVIRVGDFVCRCPNVFEKNL